MSNPRCGISLQTGVKCIAIFEIIYSLISLILTIISFMALCTLIPQFKNVSEEFPHIQEYFRGFQSTPNFQNYIPKNVIWDLIQVIRIITTSILHFVFALLLLNGASQKNAESCRTWLIAKYILLLLSIGSLFGGHILLGGFVFKDILEIIVFIYFIWVVHAFKSEVETEMETEGKVWTNREHV